MSASMLRSLGGLAVLGLAAALVGCAGLGSGLFGARSNAELLREFRAGHVRLDCSTCRFEFRDAEEMLRDGRHEQLVLSILRSGDGSGRSWYLLGRAAELSGSPQLALLYYSRSLATSRSPIVPLWPLYEDVTYRIHELAEAPAPEPQASAPAPAHDVEYVTKDSVALRSRPGQIGAYVLSLGRGEPVEVLDRSADWEQVRLRSGRTGWVWGRYTAPGLDAAPAKPAQAAARATAKAAAPAPPKAAPAKKAAAAPKRIAAASAATKPTTPSAPAAKPGPELAQASPPAEPARVRVDLAPAGSLGIFGSPLPAGSRLAGQSHGAGGGDDHPTQTYEISAGASEIVGFFEREMARSGWRKSFVSSEFLLYFVKEDRTLGVLIEREGGTFTLMGS